MQTHTPRLILASASPRRRALLQALGLSFEIHASDVDETAFGAPEEIVKELALRKARAVAREETRAWVIAADTLVALDGAVLGKPAHEDDARHMLRALSGRAHEVLTGVCLMDADSGAYDLRAETTRVVFRALTDAEIDAYIQTGEPMDKAGAYATQGGAAPFVVEYTGSYENIVGFPTQAFMEMYNRFSVRSLRR